MKVRLVPAVEAKTEVFCHSGHHFVPRAQATLYQVRPRRYLCCSCRLKRREALRAARARLQQAA